MKPLLTIISTVFISLATISVSFSKPSIVEYDRDYNLDYCKGIDVTSSYFLDDIDNPQLFQVFKFEYEGETDKNRYRFVHSKHLVYTSDEVLKDIWDNTDITDSPRLISSIYRGSIVSMYLQDILKEDGTPNISTKLKIRELLDNGIKSILIYPVIDFKSRRLVGFLFAGYAYEVIYTNKLYARFEFLSRALIPSIYECRRDIEQVN